MSKGLSVSELDMEQATFLPPREVMWGCRSGGAHYSSVHTNVGSFDGNGDGNTSQEGLVNVSLLNGNLDGVGNGDTILSL
jgi:hypothetical protein